MFPKSEPKFHHVTMFDGEFKSIIAVFTCSHEFHLCLYNSNSSCLPVNKVSHPYKKDGKAIEFIILVLKNNFSLNITSLSPLE